MIDLDELKVRLLNSAEKGIKQVSTTASTKRTINHGILIFPCEFGHRATINTKGKIHMARTILTVVAISKASFPKADAAAITELVS